MVSFISLSDSRGCLVPYFRPFLDAIAFLQVDELSIEQVRYLLETEYEQFAKVGPERYTPSAISQWVMGSLSKRSQRVHVCGLVALAMVGLHCTGQNPSQRKAVNLVADYVGRSVKEPFVYWDPLSKKHIEKMDRVTSDPATIRQIFSQFRHSAHICAARITAVDYLEPIGPFDAAPEADECLLATVVAFQHIFAKDLKKDEWNLKLLSLPETVSTSLVPLVPTTGLMEALLQETAAD